MLSTHPRRICWLWLPLATALTACLGPGFSFTPLCTNALIDPDFMSDPAHCGGCDNACDLTGAEPTCVLGQCVATHCHPNHFDLDGDPANGCECRGLTPDTCTVCLPYDAPDNDADDDCDGATDERPPQTGATTVHLDRVHCGAPGASCLLPPGAAAVECTQILCSEREHTRNECSVEFCAPSAIPGHYDCAECHAIDPGTRTFEREPECFDGLDNDGNGIRDDGPICEVLLANAVTTACSGAPPSEHCPPNHVTIPVAGDGPLAEVEVALTYDFVLDKHEVTRQQYAMFLRENGVCNLVPGGGEFSLCRVSESTARLPITDMLWCEAASYCVWAGKRLPTLAEHYRAASADAAEYGDPLDAQGLGREPTCDTVPVPVTARCGATGPVPVTQPGGDAFIGSRGRTIEQLIPKAIRHLTGNASEWLLDAAHDWCADARAGMPPLATTLVCPASGVAGNAHQRAPLVDPVFRFRPERQASGGGWDGAIDSDRYGYRWVQGRDRYPGALGFRCARSLPGDGQMDPIIAIDPRDPTVDCFVPSAGLDLP